MFALCVESSHERGMGHFYRALIIAEYLRKAGESSVVLINDDDISVRLLKAKEILYEVVDYYNEKDNWEAAIIQKYGVDVWLLDKFKTGIPMVQHVKATGIILAAIDDSGEGAVYTDLHFCSMIFNNLRGNHIYSGMDYLILNPDIVKYRRQRLKLGKIVITLGGSDTYGVTIRIVHLLKELGYSGDIIIGPNFQHNDMLEMELNSQFSVYRTVPSLIEKFQEYDLAITGGGITCFEANASGLPCIIVANEPHEIEVGKYLASFHGAKFAGYYKNVSKKDIRIDDINISEMSEYAMRAIPLTGMDNIYRIICAYRRKNAR